MFGWKSLKTFFISKRSTCCVCCKRYHVTTMCSTTMLHVFSSKWLSPYGKMTSLQMADDSSWSPMVFPILIDNIAGGTHESIHIAINASLALWGNNLRVLSNQRYQKYCHGEPFQLNVALLTRGFPFLWQGSHATAIIFICTLGWA